MTEKRSNHFPEEALDKGFPDHISTDGSAFYGDGTIIRGGEAGGGKTRRAREELGQLTLQEEIPGDLGLALITIDPERMRKLAGLTMPPEVFAEWMEKSIAQIQKMWRNLKPGDVFIHSHAIKVRLLPSSCVIGDFKPVTETEPRDLLTCILAGSPDVSLTVGHRAKNDPPEEGESWWMETSIQYEKIEPPTLWMPAPIVPVESEEDNVEQSPVPSNGDQD